MHVVSRMRPRSVLAAAAVLATLATGVAGSTTAPTQASSGFTVERLAGEDRYATAARVAQATFSTAETAILASGENFPDALAGNYLAGRRQAPVLLAHRGGVPAASQQALRQLGVRRVTLLGGEGALGPEVVAVLQASGITVDRLGGRDRFETAAAVARAAGAPTTRTAFLASGRNFADALAAGPLAYGSPIPQLLTEPGSLPATVAATLTELGITNVVVLGGTNAVGPAVESQLRGRGLTVGRLSGPDRYATSTAIADWAVGVLGHHRDHVDLATGTNFPDALAGGVHAGAHRGVVLLVEPNPESGAAARWLAEHTNEITGGHVFGGVQALAESVLVGLINAGRGLLNDPTLCETTIATLVNTDRLLRGLPGLAVVPAASNIARSWSTHLAAVGDLSHNPNVGGQLEAAGLRWWSWGENVGFAGSAIEVHSLLMSSPAHLANIVDRDYTHIGIGCAVDRTGLVWVTQNFFEL